MEVRPRRYFTSFATTTSRSRYSPNPVESAVALAKNSMRNVRFAVLASEPLIITCVPVVEALVRTGKFCRWFGPVSLSGAASLAVTIGGHSIHEVGEMSIADATGRRPARRLTSQPVTGLSLDIPAAQVGDAMVLVRAVAPAMREAGHGRIVKIGRAHV